MPRNLFLFIALSGTVLVGCQSKPLLPVPTPNVPIEVVLAAQQETERYTGQAVTWGGFILTTRNDKDQSEVVIISKRLGSSTRPISGDQTTGRFIATINGFLDPAIYTSGREMTVHGTITGKQMRKIDDYDYTYPQVKATTHILWPVPAVYDGYPNDYWYGYYPYLDHHHGHAYH